MWIIVILFFLLLFIPNIDIFFYNILSSLGWLGGENWFLAFSLGISFSWIIDLGLYITSYIWVFINFVALNLNNIFLWKIFISNSLIFTLKFLILISLLIFIRGGIPRYRYDFLTKLGWIKFLSWILSGFLSSLLAALQF